MRTSRQLDYEVVRSWEQLPEGWSFTEVAGVAVDSADRVFVFTRGEHPVIVFDRDGRFLDAWGYGVFSAPHGITIDDRDHVYLVDYGDHTIREFSTDGELRRTIGVPGVAAETGFTVGSTPVQYSAGPFNMPTNVAVDRNGRMFVADGYGNARVHRYSPDGRLEHSWGEPGNGPGQFNLPHGIALDSASRVYVADRENSRVQRFTASGDYIDSWEFVNRPADIYIDGDDTIYIAELSFAHYKPPAAHFRFMLAPPAGHEPIARVTVCDRDGTILTRIGGAQGVLPGNFISPHGIWADSHGDIYVGEVVVTSGAVAALAPLDCHTFQKFRRTG